MAILGFIGLEYYLVHSPFAAKLASSMTGGMSWLVVLGLFMGVSFIANKLALSKSSQQMQYLGLGLFVIAEAIIFLPLLFIATFYAGAGLIQTAGLMTLLLVGGITATVFITKKDFSFMGSILSIGGFVALGFIVCSMIFGFSLGLVFALVMVLLRRVPFSTRLLISFTNTEPINMWRRLYPCLLPWLSCFFTFSRF